MRLKEEVHRALNLKQQATTPDVIELEVIDLSSDDDTYSTQSQECLELLEDIDPTKQAAHPEADQLESDAEIEDVNMEDTEDQIEMIETGCEVCYQMKEEIVRSPCNHRCCPKCWQEWLRKKEQCPFCRYDLSKDHQFLEKCGINED